MHTWAATASHGTSIGVKGAVQAAHVLAAPTDILAVRKLGAPGNPELAVGAVAEDGTAVLDPRSASLMGMTQAMLDATLAEESEELRRRVERYRDGRAAIPLEGRTAIAIDDGMATGGRGSCHASVASGSPTASAAASAIRSCPSLLAWSRSGWTRSSRRPTT